MTTSAHVDCGGGIRLERGVPCRMSNGPFSMRPLLSIGARSSSNLLMRQPYGRYRIDGRLRSPIWFRRHGYKSSSRMFATR